MARTAPRIVAVSGHVSLPSRTEWLARHLAERLAQAVDGTAALHGIADDPADLGRALARGQASPRLEAVLREIEGCDALVAVTPVYKGSLAGLFKHLFDLVDRHALAGRPVIVAATGYTERHAGVVDHALRPLFGFFDADVIGPGLFVGKADVDEQRQPTPALAAAMDLLISRAARRVRDARLESTP